MPEGKVLTAETVPAYLAERANLLKSVFPDEDEAASLADKLEVSPILGGNVNYAFCVSLGDKKVFVKQAPEYVAIFGPDGFPLTSERMQQEMDVYQEWRTLLGDDSAATWLPEIYFFDKSHMTVCMEFFDGYQLLDHVLVSENKGGIGATLSQVARGLGDFMGQTHAATHSSNVDAARKEYLIQHYENRAVRIANRMCTLPPFEWLVVSWLDDSLLCTCSRV